MQARDFYIYQVSLDRESLKCNRSNYGNTTRKASKLKLYATDAVRFSNIET